MLVYIYPGKNSHAGCPAFLFFQDSYFFLYLEQTYIFLYIWKKLIFNCRISCFHRNLQQLSSSFWGPPGPQTPADMWLLMFMSNTQCRRRTEFLFWIYWSHKEVWPCIIVLISLSSSFVYFFMFFFVLLEGLFKPLISYFTPIFLTSISYIFELKIYILHQSALGSLVMYQTFQLITCINK